VAGMSPSGGSGQRSSTLRARSSSGSGSKPAVKKLGAVPLRNTVEQRLAQQWQWEAAEPADL